MLVFSKPVIFIPNGSTPYIVKYLNHKSYNLNLIDEKIIKLLGYPQSGWIDLKSTAMSKGDFLFKLTTSKAALRNIVLIPGETYFFFLNTVSKKLKLSKQKLFRYYDKYKFKKDGNIIANTYSLPIGMDEEELILYLFKYTNKKYKKYSLKIFGQYNQKNWFKYIAIASIIQKEAASKQEMPLISSVIYNRLKKNMKLQMDGALNYGQYSHTKVTPQRIKTDNSLYNTYKFKGIPKDPVCAVELSAIKAAIFPKKTNYLYFMKNSKGTAHIFSSTYKKHKQIIKNIKQVTKRNKSSLVKSLWKNVN